jgi:hypothetical protein
MPLLKMLPLRSLWVAFAAMLATAGVVSAQTTITSNKRKTTTQGFEGLSKDC